jgi:hypothetical protein
MSDYIKKAARRPPHARSSPAGQARHTPTTTKPKGREEEKLLLPQACMVLSVASKNCILLLLLSRGGVKQNFEKNAENKENSGGGENFEPVVFPKRWSDGGQDI